MLLQYQGKKTEETILQQTKRVIFSGVVTNNANTLLKGENLGILKSLLEDHNLRGKIDLIYIDPPFATDSHFTIGDERVSTISNSRSDKTAYHDKMVGSDFLEFLRERLIFLRELMSDRASIYLHIDYKIGHYIKITMDEVFGEDNFRNDIARIKCNPKNFHRKAYGNIKDLILFYSKTSNSTWNEPKEEFSQADIERLFKKIDKDGRRYTTIPLHAPGETQDGPTGQAWRGQKPPKGRHWRSDPKILEEWDKQGLIEWSKNRVPRKKIFVDEKEGKKIQDIWEFKDAQYPSYPTEKNIDLLRHIIRASSNPGDLVLDCFCGSGTTLQVAQELGRHWIGIDQSEEAIRVTKKRLEKIPLDLFSGNKNYNYYEVEEEVLARGIHPQPPLPLAKIEKKSNSYSIKEKALTIGI